MQFSVLGKGLYGATAMMCFAAPLGAARPVSASSKLEGEWVSQCSPVGQNGRHGSIVRLTIKGNSILAAGQVYAHTSCDQPTMKGGFAGIVRRVRDNGDRIALDYELRDAGMTLQRPEVVDYYNSHGGCGLSGWRLGIRKSILGHRCGSLDMPAGGQMLYDSAWVSGDELRMGAFPLDTSNRSPEARPVGPARLVFRRVLPSGRPE